MSEDEKAIKLLQNFIDTQVKEALKSELLQIQKTQSKAIETLSTLMKEMSESLRIMVKDLSKQAKHITKIERAINPKGKRRKKTDKKKDDYIA